MHKHNGFSVMETGVVFCITWTMLCRGIIAHSAQRVGDFVYGPSIHKRRTAISLTARPAEPWRIAGNYGLICQDLQIPSPVPQVRFAPNISASSLITCLQNSAWYSKYNWGLLSQVSRHQAHPLSLLTPSGTTSTPWRDWRILGRGWLIISPWNFTHYTRIHTSLSLHSSSNKI